MRNKTTLINTITTLLQQIVSFLSGFIIPKLILSTFGSETNGLVLSLNQFLNYIALIEGGINGVIIASLYKPLVEKDDKKISSIIKTSNSFLRKISFILVAYTVGLAVVYPLVSNSSFSWQFISTLTLILSIKLFVQYCFSLTLRNLLNADKKVYYVSLTQTLLSLLDIAATVIVVKIFPSIHALKFVSAIIFAMQPIIYSRYVNKHYSIKKNVKEDKKLLRNRWDGFAINTAAFIHNNTDVAILSIFRSLHEASVYGVYALVTTGLKTLCQSLWKALGPSIGKLYAANNTKELNNKFDIFEFITMVLTFFVFSIASLLITPFVQIYTSGITDANYYQPIFGYIIVAAEAMYILREPYVNLAYSAGKFKDLRICAAVEAILNIAVSLCLAPKLGLIGIAIGTLIGMSYRTFYQIWYLRDHLINRPFIKFLKRFLVFLMPTLITIAACGIILPVKQNSILSWILHAAIYSAIFGIEYFAISSLFFRSQMHELKKYIKKG